jgi:carboxypeptidase Taq
MRPEAAYAELIGRSREDALVAACASLLEWDQETYMPAGAVDARGEQLAFLAGQLHDRASAPRLGELLAALEGSALTTDADAPPAVNVREIRRGYDRQSRIPRGLAEDLARTTARAQQEWAGARADDDFARFRPWLGRIVALKRDEAACVGFVDSPYDALLDDYEPGARAADVARLYAAVRAELVPLIDAIIGAPRQPAVELLQRGFAIDRQQAFARLIATAVGFDFTHGRLDLSVHPFCTRIGPGDVRLTTRYRTDDLEEGLFGVLHEVGHGLYEQGLDPAHDGTPMGEAVSLGVHESQSRFWENRIGRGRAFWRFAFEHARAAFAPTIDDVTPDALHFAINHVARTPIRVRADEVTYNLHTLIRFELEVALITGALDVADVPEAWNDGYRRHLGLTPVSDREGCLQDSHWSAGLIGYFPTYTLGDIYSAQLVDAATRDLGDLDARIATGDFAPLLDWLRTHVHRQGRRYAPALLIAQATGSPPDHRPLIAGLRRKYTELYAL